MTGPKFTVDDLRLSLVEATPGEDYGDAGLHAPSPGRRLLRPGDVQDVTPSPTGCQSREGVPHCGIRI
jgi:hypothetical protein